MFTCGDHHGRRKGPLSLLSILQPITQSSATAAQYVQAVTGIHVDYQPLGGFRPGKARMLAAGSYPDLWMFPPQLWPASQGPQRYLLPNGFHKDTPYDIALAGRQVEAITVNGRWMACPLHRLGGAEPSLQHGVLESIGIPDLNDQRDFYQIDRKLYQALTKEGIAGSTMGIHGSSAHETIMMRSCALGSLRTQRSHRGRSA